MKPGVMFYHSCFEYLAVALRIITFNRTGDRDAHQEGIAVHWAADSEEQGE